MTALYPRERVEAVLQPLSLASAYRIVLKPHLATPLAVRPSKSRFCDGGTYAVLYGASDFATAFVEVVVRDRAGFRFFSASRRFNSLEGKLFRSPREAERVAMEFAQRREVQAA